MSGLPGCSRLIRPTPNRFMSASRTGMPLNLPGFARTRSQQRGTPTRSPASPHRRRSRIGLWARVTARVWQPRSRENSRRPMASSSRHWTRPAAAGQGLSWRPEYSAFQADNLMRMGDSRRAGEVAAEAIGVARRKADRLAECHASLVAATRACGPRDAEEAGRLLNRASVLIDETGATVYEPMLLRARG